MVRPIWEEVSQSSQPMASDHVNDAGASQGTSSPTSTTVSSAPRAPDQPSSQRGSGGLADEAASSAHCQCTVSHGAASSSTRRCPPHAHSQPRVARAPPRPSFSRAVRWRASPCTAPSPTGRVSPRLGARQPASQRGGTSGSTSHVASFSTPTGPDAEELQLHQHIAYR